MQSASHSLRLMGASITLTIFHEDAQNLLLQSEQLLHLYKNRFSANDVDSELMEINLQAGKKAVQVHPELFELIKLGKKHSIAANSHLNIAIGPLVQTWRIGFSDAKLPSEEEIQRLLKITNPEEIVLNDLNREVYLSKEGMRIDLGALAKGYIADKLKEFLIEKGVQSGIIDLGGNILTIGENPTFHRPWRIGIQNPALDRGNHVAVIEVSDTSVVTSGIYERQLVVDGKTYHHIFDRTTGYPMETELVSITIVAEKSVDCEIWTTRLFGQNPYDIIEEIEQQPGLEAFVITKNQKMMYTSGIHFV
ncbi:FAD:protein FMN transferase [uncultured Granulicatella sp.]|uniref:FAD:protein FMN transferase n=1 Tax=uncultured Granulicatella sp. TaxID=316089 RepID=UPI0028D6F434|nr:FAD:protein FMN transferase [uncultured Granulicatella sp.]